MPRRLQPALLLAVASISVLLEQTAGATPKPRSSEKPFNEYEATNLEQITSSEDFLEKITSVVNVTDVEHAREVGADPLYYPVVFFHVSWCDHCHYAMSELDTAAKELLDATAGGRVVVPPRFFVIECDKVARDLTALCDRHIGTQFPALALFRENRVLKFGNRLRKTNILRWWIARNIRPFLMGVRDIADITSMSEPLYVMKANFQADEWRVNMWRNFSALYMEGYSFAVADPLSEVGKAMTSELSFFSPERAGLSPLPFTGDVENHTEMEVWIAINRFPALGTLPDIRIFFEYQRSNVQVIILVHGGGKAGKQAKKHFAGVVKHLRPSGKYLFLAVNASAEAERAMITRKLPLLAPAVTAYPRVIGMKGHIYFEDPDIISLDNETADDVMQALFADWEARQDITSNIGWAKEKKKIFLRFAQKSHANKALAIAIIVIAIAFCYVGGKMLWESPSDPGQECRSEESQAAELKKVKDAREPKKQA